MSSKGETETSQELYEDHEIYEDLQNVISSLKEQLLIQERRLAAHSQQLDFKSDEIRVLRRQLAAQSLVREQKRKMVNSIGGPLNQNQIRALFGEEELLHSQISEIEELRSMLQQQQQENSMLKEHISVLTQLLPSGIAPSQPPPPSRLSNLFDEKDLATEISDVRSASSTLVDVDATENTVLSQEEVSVLREQLTTQEELLVQQDEENRVLVEQLEAQEEENRLLREQVGVLAEQLATQAKQLASQASQFTTQLEQLEEQQRENASLRRRLAEKGEETATTSILGDEEEEEDFVYDEDDFDPTTMSSPPNRGTNALKRAQSEQLPSATHAFMDDDSGRMSAKGAPDVPPPNVHTGYMSKEGQLFKTWKRRFFVLEKGLLSYYEGETAPNSKIGSKKIGESICLAGYTVTALAKNRLLLSKWSASGKSRQLLLELDDEGNLNGWSNALNEHIAYLAKMPSEVVVTRRKRTILSMRIN